MNYQDVYVKIDKLEAEYLTQQEVAALCHLSKKTVYKLERSGKLPYQKQVNRLIHTHLIRRADVLRMLRERSGEMPTDSCYYKAMCQHYCGKIQGEPDILELGDIIRLTGFSKSGVLKWLSSGKLLSFRAGRFYKIPKAGLLKFWLSPTYRNIKNKSAVQKLDLQAIDMLCAAMELARCSDDRV